MLTGIQSGAYFNDKDAYLPGWELSLSQASDRIAALGYSCMDYQNFVHTDTELFDYSPVKFASRLETEKKIIRNAGLSISQTHGPWRWPPRDSDASERAERLEKMTRSLEGTRLLDCRYMAVHPIMPYGPGDNPDPERFLQLNLEFFSRLVQQAAKYEVTLCLENMPFPALTLARPQEILDFVRILDSPWMRVCLDTGHCAVLGLSAADEARRLGDSLAILHVHDNDGRGDLHWAPYAGVTDWEDFSRALRQIGFNGVVSLETDHRAVMPASAKDNPEQGLAALAARIAGIGLHT